MKAQGLTPGIYNLPDWDETVMGLQSYLESLFRYTPPTAIIADEAPFYFAVRHFLAARGLSVPGDVSIVCTDGDRNFAWCTPSVAHIRWDHLPLVLRVMKWANNVSHGKDDNRQTFIKAEFVPGGTIGRAKRG
jgi:DNA-binding LacI/PurR family transcriptional regulator